MKKEIPRLLKSSSIVYAFDCFDTIFSKVPISLSDKEKTIFNPDILNIRWVLIVPDSKWYKLKALLLCVFNGVIPFQIIKCSNWIYKSKDSYKPIRQMLIDIIDHKDIINYVDKNKVNKVYYISNNQTIIDAINQSIERSSYDITAVNLIDFWQNKFTHLM